MDWCRAFRGGFIAAGRIAYNWTGRRVQRGNLLAAEGNWRVDGQAHLVECHAARGARRGLATLSIGPR